MSQTLPLKSQPLPKTSGSRVSPETLKWLLDQPSDVKISMLENHLDLCRLLIHDILEEEVRSLCGDRYHHHKPHDGRYSRWGYNPSSVQIGAHRLLIEVPRIRDNATGKMRSLETVERLSGIIVDEEYLMRAVMLGLSVRDFASLNPDQGLKKSALDARFIENSKRQYEKFRERRLDHLSLVGLFIDGKSLFGEMMVIAMGVTLDGRKIPLHFIQTTTENHVSCKDLMSNLNDRGLQTEGILCVVDGSKGLIKALNQTWRGQYVLQRCQWHKRENIVSYLPKNDQPTIRKRIQAAYREETYEQAHAQLMNIRQDVARRNQSAAHALDEGLEETLALHRMAATGFSRSFATTNCIENLNSILGKTTRNVKHWMNSDQRHRWIGASLLEAEQRLRRVQNHANLSALKQAVQMEIGLLDPKQTTHNLTLNQTP